MMECRAIDSLSDCIRLVSADRLWHCREEKLDRRSISQIHGWYSFAPCEHSLRQIRLRCTREHVQQHGTISHMCHEHLQMKMKIRREGKKLFLTEERTLTLRWKWDVCTNWVINYDIVSSGIKFRAGRVGRNILQICSLISARCKKTKRALQACGFIASEN